MGQHHPASKEENQYQESTDTQERRDFPRAEDGHLDVHFKILDNDHLLSEYKLGRSKNVSFGGVCFVTEKTMDVGCLLALELSSADLPQPITALGTVVRTDGEGGDSSRVSVEFLWTGIEEPAHEGLKSYVRDQLIVK